MNVAIIFAGGTGTRMGADKPKQFLDICGKPVLVWTLQIFESHPRIDAIVLVVNPEFIIETEDICRQYSISKIRAFATGGATTQDSIFSGLCKTAEMYPSNTTVLLHDGVRPYLDPSVIDAVIESVENYGNGVTYTPCYETIVLSRDGTQVDTIPARNESFTAQAPQGFKLKDVLAAHAKVRSMPSGYDGLVDQATLYWKLGLPIHLVKGNRGNIKITTPEDMCTLQALLEWRDAKEIRKKRL